MALMRKIAQAQADVAAARTPAPLAVSTAPWPGDVRLLMHVQPGASLGFADVQIGLGRGSKGRGQRPGDDHALIVATARRLAAHLCAYADSYEQAAQDDAPAAHCRVCGAAGTLAHDLCPECYDQHEPF